MFEVQRQNQKQTCVIRPATEAELSNYDKQKLAGIEENAQRNKLEIININGKRLQTDPITKEVNIELGDLAFKQSITSDDISQEETFFINCELD